MKFFVGLHQVSDAQHFERAMISFNRLRNRKSDFKVKQWLMDSGAYSEIRAHGCHRTSASDYIAAIKRWQSCGDLLAAASQDYTCDPESIKRTGWNVLELQIRSVERYVELWQLSLHDSAMLTDIMPVLHGVTPLDYLRHLDLYSICRFPIHDDQLVGVGSLVWRRSAQDVEQIINLIHRERPSLRLHGFGVKSRVLALASVHDALWSCDSNAWSHAARYEGRNANDWREARRYAAKIERMPSQLNLIHHS